ncbi:MAG: helix-turn-helix transcriptional regulator [Clostridia bacterium]|nr:helix-turn-helix transcriptional regulator [Clostridia bacterium]
MAYIRIPLKNILSVNRIITVFRFHFAPDYKTVGESHDFWELVYVDKGELGLMGGERMHHVTAGEMILHKPNEFHRVECDGVHAARVFIITFECRSGAMKFFYDKVLSVPSELRTLMRQLLDECGESFLVSSCPLQIKDEQPIGGLQLIRNYLECILIRMMREGERVKESTERFFRSREMLEAELARDIRAYLEAHLYERLSLDALSREFHFSVSTLCNIYKKVKGQTIMHSHLMLKLEEAKRLLRAEPTPISEISSRLGFETPQYFSRIFCRYVGMPPRDFRES